MGVLSHLEPQSVFNYFEEISRIPHGSGNTDQISDYLVGFARERNLFYIQDAVKNVIIVKEATPGYEEEPAIILQGHMDMVAVKKPDCDIDMEKDGLRLAVKDDYVYAEGTSLGGDDGIAVAFALALLDSDSLEHPRLEVVITVDEEVGMDGAREIDLSKLKGKRMLNIDTDEEGFFMTSCAGGARLDIMQPLSAMEQEGCAYEIVLTGLLGGHSGIEIHKGGGNANSLMGRVLWNLVRKSLIRIVDAAGGLADNAISREARAVVLIAPDKEDSFIKAIGEEDLCLKEELGKREPDFSLYVTKKTDKSYLCLTHESTVKCAALLHALPNGVQAMSAEIENLAETSLNNGQMSLMKNDTGEVNLHIRIAVRSSIDSAKWALISRVEAILSLTGGTLSISGDYPGWKYRADSPLRDKMTALYERMYGVKPRVEAIHAGLECGILCSKIADLDCVSFGPDMKDIHTTEEVLSISSTKRVWEFLIRLLAGKDTGELYGI